MKAAIFVRVSTNRQDYTRQINDLKKEAERQKLKIVKVIKEKQSGTSKRKERQGIQELLQLASSGQIDKVLTTEVSRLGRSTGDNLQLLDELTEMGVSIYALDVGMDTLQNGKRTMVAEILFAVLSSLARQERERLSERIISGLEEARRKGKQLGRPKGLQKPVEQMKEYKAISRNLRQNKSIRDVAAICGVSAAHVQKIKKHLN